jgi:RNA polymerase sigma-70 factor (ECF subfamily)
MGSIPEQPSESEVIRGLMDGCEREENFRMLFTRYYPKVKRYFTRRGFGEEDSRDLAQEVFVAVHRNIATLNNEGAFVGWLFAIARRTGARNLKRLKRDDVVFEEAGAGPAGKKDTLGNMLERERVEAVRQAIEQLPERARAHVSGAENYREIGRQLGISEDTVAVHMHRATRSLRESLAGFASGRRKGRQSEYGTRPRHRDLRAGGFS